MKVYELISWLETFPQDIPIFVEDGQDPSDLTEPYPRLQPKDDGFRRLGAPQDGDYITL